MVVLALEQGFCGTFVGRADPMSKHMILRRCFFVINSFVDVDPRNSALGSALRLFLGTFPAIYACIR